jgi:two-component system LytT family response regulator
MQRHKSLFVFINQFQTKMKVILIDDEVVANESLTLIINEFLPDVEVAGTARSADEARELLTICKPDLIFLDIEMPGEDGFDFLKNLKNIDFQIIFITAYNQYAIKAFKFSAVDYLVKPVKIPELINAVNRAKSLSQRKEITDIRALLENIQSSRLFKIALNTTDGREYINVDDIIHIEGDVNYSKLFLTDKRVIMASKTLKLFDEMLTGSGFYRTHKSSLVNLKYVKKILTRDGLCIEMADGFQTKLALHLKEEFIQIMDKYTK